MPDDGALLAVVAHGLINSLSAIQGMTASARGLVEVTAPGTPETERAVRLLEVSQARTELLVEQLRVLAGGQLPLALIEAARATAAADAESDAHHPMTPES